MRRPFKSLLLVSGLICGTGTMGLAWADVLLGTLHTGGGEGGVNASGTPPTAVTFGVAYGVSAPTSDCLCTASIPLSDMAAGKTYEFDASNDAQFNAFADTWSSGLNLYAVMAIAGIGSGNLGSIGGGTPSGAILGWQIDSVVVVVNNWNVLLQDVNQNPACGPALPVGCYNITQDLTFKFYGTGQTYAGYTIPEPGTVSLFGLGLVGLKQKAIV